MTLILVGGGARSGKSTYAQDRALALAAGARPLYLATSDPTGDEEMLDRVRRHRDDRGDAFDTVEAPRDLAGALNAAPPTAVILVDCLTVWLANVLMADGEVDLEAVLDAARSRTGHTLFVTNEVGEGIVPMHPVSRRFRDESGFMNQRFAAACDEVVYLRFGLPQRLK